MSRKIPGTIIFAIILFFLSCQNQAEKGGPFGLTDKLGQLSDSIQVEGLVVRNLFKSQILAHNNKSYDSAMIVEKVYNAHKALWDSCYGMIFGEENASKFNTPMGMIEWNRTLYPENKAFFDTRANELLEINLDSVLRHNLKKFAELVPYQPKATISILFTPLQGIGFGGCKSDQFCFELNNVDYNVAHTVEQGIPHELNHLAYEPLRVNDPSKGTALAQTIDEGFACYFTWVFFDKKISKHVAVENMSEADWNWYMKNEKAIFTSVKKYFDDRSGNNPLLRNDKLKLFADAPKSLNYWLGFRIIEKYIEVKGQNAWKDIYTLNAKDVLLQSGYEEYIDGLK